MVEWGCELVETHRVEDVEDGGMDDDSEVKMMMMVETGNMSTHKVCI